MEVRSLTAARRILDDLTQSSKHRKKPKKKNTLIKLLKPICRRIVSLLVSLVFPRDSARRLDVLVGNRRRLLQRHGKQFLWGGESRRTARRAISRPRPRIRRAFDISCGSFASLGGVTSACLAAESAWGQSFVITRVNEELTAPQSNKREMIWIIWQCFSWT